MGEVRELVDVIGKARLTKEGQGLCEGGAVLERRTRSAKSRGQRLAENLGTYESTERDARCLGFQACALFRREAHGKRLCRGLVGFGHVIL